MTHDRHTPESQKHMLARVDDLTFADPDLVQRWFGTSTPSARQKARSVSTNRKLPWAEALPAHAAAGRDMQVPW